MYEHCVTTQCEIDYAVFVLVLLFPEARQMLSDYLDGSFFIQFPSDTSANFQKEAHMWLFKDVLVVLRPCFLSHACSFGSSVIKMNRNVPKLWWETLTVLHTGK